MKTTIAASLLLSLAAAGPISGTSGTIKPTVISQYHVSTGAIDFNTGSGKVFKDGRSSDITTLATFRIPQAARGATCQLHFAANSAATVSGTSKFDVFTSQASASTSTKSWPHGNLRDHYVGRFQAIPGGGEARPGADGISTVVSFACPAGQVLAGELVGVGDKDDIEWTLAQGGPFITYFGN